MGKRTRSLVLSAVLCACLSIMAMSLTGCFDEEATSPGEEDTAQTGSFETSITNPFNQVKKNRVFSIDGKTYAVRTDELNKNEELYEIDGNQMHLDIGSQAPSYINCINNKLYFYTVGYELDGAGSGTIAYKFLSSDIDGSHEKALIVLNLTQTSDSFVFINGVHIYNNTLYYTIIKTDSIGIRTDLHKFDLDTNKDTVYYQAEQYCDVAYLDGDTYIAYFGTYGDLTTRAAFKIDSEGNKTPCAKLGNALNMFGANGQIYFTSTEDEGDDYTSSIQRYEPEDETVSEVYAIKNSQLIDFTIDGDTLYMSYHYALDDEDTEHSVIKSVGIEGNKAEEKVLLESQCPFMEAETESVSYKSLIKIGNKLYYENVYHDTDKTPSRLGVVDLETGQSSLLEVK